MLDKIIPLKINYFLDLIRFFKPIGFMLLMWPCWFALALLPINYLDLIKWYGLFFIGAFLMRSAGCVINDLIDINIDIKTKRTKNRPLASKKISVIEAFIILSILLILSLIVLFQFNFLSILIGVLSFPFIVLYPYMKRHTYWPQVFLGIIFSWGIIIVASQFLTNFIWDYFLLYIGCIFWTLAYDTIYAYQDRDDDIQNKIKSTAVFLGDKGIKYVKFFYLIFFLIIGYLSFNSSNNFYSLIVIIIVIFAMNYILNKWNPISIKSSNFYFKFNNAIGLFCFLFLLIF
jgi:4-hydroxybenzoate polyprenyltransferase